MSENKSLSTVFVKGTFFLGSWGMVGKIINLFNSFLVIYVLSLYEYGLYSLILSIVSVTEVVLVDGMDQLIVNEILYRKSQNEEAKAKKIYHQYFVLKLVFGILAFLILFLGADIIDKYVGNHSIALFIRLSSFFTFFAGRIAP